MSMSPEAIPARAAAPAGFWEWVEGFPLRLRILFAVVMAAAMVQYLSQSVVPEPLGVLTRFSPAFVGVAVLLTWALRAWLPRHLRAVTAATTGLLTALILVHLLFVKPVQFRTTVNGVTDVDTVSFITGWAVADPALRNMTAEDQIRMVGTGPDELRAIWGGTFLVMVAAYSLLYVLVINGLIFSFGGTDLAQSGFFDAQQPAPGGRPRSAPGKAGKNGSRAKKR